MHESYIKNIELVSNTTSSGSKKAVIRTKWNTKDDRVDFLIFVRDSTLVFVGKCSQTSLQKKNGSSFEAVKDSLTSLGKLDKISYEFDEKKSKFAVVAQETFDSETSFGEIIYLRIDVTKLESSEAMPVIIELLDEMISSQSDIAALEGKLAKFKQDLKETSARLEKLGAEKVEFDKNTFQSFLLLINSKKKRIAELERKLQRSKPIDSKFANLSSDFDQSDVSARSLKTPNTSPKKPRTIVLDEFNDEDSRPSTSAAAHNSPARTKVTPKSSSHATEKPRTPRRTPRKARNQLFQFKELKDSDDSSDDLDLMVGKSPKAFRRQLSNNSSILDGMEVKLTKKLNINDEVNQSSAELFIPKTQGRSKSSSSEVSRGKSMTPDLIQPAQLFELENSQNQKVVPRKAPKKIAKRRSSEELFQSDQEDFTQKHDGAAETVENSQPNDSPSIFESYSKRKPQQTVLQTNNKRSKLEFNKSKFSVDTIDILANESA